MKMGSAGGAADQLKKELRRGFTTGTCAAAAVWGAAYLAVKDHLGLALPDPGQAEIMTPKGVLVTIPLLEKERGAGTAACAVVKDSGDDPDVTNGTEVWGRVTLLPAEKGVFQLTGGTGVGRVTKPGLACEVGQPAINPTPRKMIEEQFRRLAEDLSYEGGIRAEISVPEGERLAKRTYNPRLGIVGGISILGTSGIVEPMSEQALIDTIRVEMNVRQAAGARYLVVTPGNYGETFLREQLAVNRMYAVKCSNFIGETLAFAQEMRFAGVLLVGHIGKFVKLGAGIFNTHSKYGDSRLEILTAHAAMAGADRDLCRQLMDCVMMDDGLNLLAEAGLKDAALASLLVKIQDHLNLQTGGDLKTGAILFSNKTGFLGQTQTAAELLSVIREDPHERI